MYICRGLFCVSFGNIKDEVSNKLHLYFLFDLQFPNINVITLSPIYVTAKGKVMSVMPKTYVFEV